MCASTPRRRHMHALGVFRYRDVRRTRCAMLFQTCNAVAGLDTHARWPYPRCARKHFSTARLGVNRPRGLAFSLCTAPSSCTHGAVAAGAVRWRGAHAISAFVLSYVVAQRSVRADIFLAFRPITIGARVRRRWRWTRSGRAACLVPASTHAVQTGAVQPVHAAVRCPMGIDGVSRYAYLVDVRRRVGAWFLSQYYK